VRPWVITNEGDTWFTKQKNADTLYVIVKQNPRWAYGAWRDIVLHSVRATAQTEVSVLGQNDEVLEYRSDVIPKTTFEQRPDGLHIRAMRAQRVYNNRQWPNPVVLKLTHVQPALVPPRVDTSTVRWDAAAGVAICEADLQSLGDQTSLEVGFEYRDTTGMDLTERLGATWQATEFTHRTAVGTFSLPLQDLAAGHSYEVRAVVRHPLLSLYGREVQLSVP
jgi:alpha-L-fucosidase